jgi:hypothetical protein
MGVEHTDESLVAQSHSIEHLFDLLRGDYETQVGVPVELPIGLENGFPFRLIPEICRARINAGWVIKILPADQAECFVRQGMDAGMYQFAEQ